MRKIQFDKIVEAIRSVNLIRIRANQAGMVEWSEGGEIVDSRMSVEYDDPPQSKWFTYTVAMDVPKFQRIHNDLGFTQNSAEYDYFVDSILYEIKSNLDVIIRMGQRKP
jgi:hypothetical protein